MAAFTACPAISCSIRFSFVPGQGVRPDFSGTAAAPVVGTAADRIYEGGKQALSYWATGTAPALAIRSLAAVEVAKSKKAWAASGQGLIGAGGEHEGTLNGIAAVQDRGLRGSHAAHGQDRDALLILHGGEGRHSRWRRGWYGPPRSRRR